jgi:pimeloyl-ACP methyl ester carboxylesterase
MSAMTQTLTIAGTDIHVEGTGAETLLLLHGWPDTHRLWDGTVAALADRSRCCRLTLPGFEPGSARRRPTLAEMNDFLLRVVDAPLRFHSPAWADALARRPGNRVEPFATGHWVMHDEPARFHQLLRDWLGAPASTRPS